MPTDSVSEYIRAWTGERLYRAHRTEVSRLYGTTMGVPTWDELSWADKMSWEDDANEQNARDAQED